MFGEDQILALGRNLTIPKEVAAAFGERPDEEVRLVIENVLELNRALRESMPQSLDLKLKWGQVNNYQFLTTAAANGITPAPTPTLPGAAKPDTNLGVGMSM